MAYQILEKIERNCTTCQYNFQNQNVCAGAHYGVSPDEILKDQTNFPCSDYKIDFSLYLELAKEGKIKLL